MVGAEALALLVATVAGERFAQLHSVGHFNVVDISTLRGQFLQDSLGIGCKVKDGKDFKKEIAKRERGLNSEKSDWLEQSDRQMLGVRVMLLDFQPL